MSPCVSLLNENTGDQINAVMSMRNRVITGWTAFRDQNETGTSGMRRE
jgi:hypothetical protein